MSDRGPVELKPVSGKNFVWADITDEQGLFGGKDEKKSLRGFVGNKDVNLVERQDLQDSGVLYSEKWKLAKDAGLPVVPTLRKTEQGTVVMTDITADGSEVYGKGAQDGLDGNVAYKPLKLATQYLRVTEGAEFAKIVDKAAELARAASGKGILLPADDPFELCLHPDGSWDLVILDLERCEKAKVDENLFEENLEFAQSFIGDLKRIRETLLSAEELKDNAKI